jgi:hypothetical protein
MHRLRLIVAGSVVAVWQLLPAVSVRAELSKSVIITGLKASSTSEYVEIANVSDTLVDLTGWKIEYSNSSGSNIKVLANLSGELTPDSYLVFASSAFTQAYPQDPAVTISTLLYSGLSDSGGYVRIYEPTLDIANYPTGFMKVDEVGWSSSSIPSTSPAIFSYTGAVSLHRCTDARGAYVYRDDNRTDFYTIEQPLLVTPGATCSDLVVEDPVEEEPPTEEEDDVPEEVIVPNTCDGIVINELLPNPEGSDVGKEFVELYNRALSDVKIGGCRLEVAGGKSYVLPAEMTIQPNGFIVLGDAVTDIILVNSQSATMYLVGENGSEVSTATYIADLDDNQSWSLFDDTYASTYSATPGASNVLTPLKPCESGYIRSEDTGRCAVVPVPTVADDLSCDVGYERNPVTNRCRKITTSIPLAPCPSGQERNPATNRCRSIVLLTSVLSACDEGEERNPATNRCRKIDTGTDLVPCPIGQERNPDTNRCRKANEVIVSDTESANDVPTPQSTSPLPLGVIAAGSLGYAAYEWRREFMEAIAAFLNRFRRR